MAKRHDRGPLARASDEVRSWFRDEAAERRERDERRGGSPFGWRGDRWPNRNDYRHAGETILGRADWGDRESDYEHGFRAFRGESGWRGSAGWDVPPRYEGPGVVRRRQPLWANYAGRGPRGYRRSDESIHDDVCDRLTMDPRVDAFDIEVRVQNGEVTLAGNVNSREQKRRAEDVAALVSGVRDVINELRVTLL
jgi:hypothetical protein